MLLLTIKEIQKSDMIASMKFCPGNWSCGNITVTMKNKKYILLISKSIHLTIN